MCIWCVVGMVCVWCMYDVCVICLCVVYMDGASAWYICVVCMQDVCMCVVSGVWSRYMVCMCVVCVCVWCLGWNPFPRRRLRAGGDQKQE